ncbi:hypothetical protein DENSPDRAFT_850311 [Dentipellis sp. KUC8613]|nr:hypothetical protein DENSPDRAFT_850311 [Dentipellis sp. KUC8613]
MDVEIIDVDALPDIKRRSPPRAYMNLISSDEEQEPVKKERLSELRKTVEEKYNSGKKRSATQRLAKSKSKRAKTGAGPSHIAQQLGTGSNPISIDSDSDDNPVELLSMNVDTSMDLAEEFIHPESPTFPPSPSPPTDSEDEYSQIHAAFQLDNNANVGSFRQAGGSINRVSQSAGVIGISSATPGGGPDEDTSSAVDPQNREGTLQIWIDGQNHILSEHANVQTFNNRVQQKFYTVHDVEFDPHRPHIFASTGDDCITRLWKISSESRLASPRRTINFPDAPHDLHYNPYDFKLAITCLDGCIYVYPDPVTNLAHHTFPLAPGVRHSAGAMVWGHNDTAHHIFASSEPKDPSDDEGYHKVFDIGKLDVAYELDAKESGDGMAITSTGQQLALLTHAEDSHKLRIYDVGHKRGRHVASVLLEPFSFSCPDSLWPDGEVTSASFSPDDMLLSVARNDNTLHVYDTRFLGKGPCCKFVHWGEERSVDTGWGITGAIWVQSWNRKGLGICSDEDLNNGQVLTQTSYDIGHFSIGDKHKGEKPLVV